MIVKKLYKHQPESISESKGTTIIRDIAIQTNRNIKRNRPDMMAKDYKKHVFKSISPDKQMITYQSKNMIKLVNI